MPGAAGQIRGVRLEAVVQFLFDLAIFVLPFGGALAAGAITDKAGPAISGPASLLGLVGGIWLFSKLMTLAAL
jgi:hypothetical protein